MFKVKRSAILFLVIYFVVFYAWLYLFRDYAFQRILGTGIFLIIGESVGIVWIVRSFLAITGKQRYFWLISGIGALFSFVAYIIWFYHRLILDIDPSYPSLGDYLWLIACFICLIALLYYIKVTGTSMSIIPFFSNTLIFMTIAVVVSIHFLIIPIMSMSNLSSKAIFVTLAYPIMDLGILFVVINLLYLSQYSGLKKRYLIIAIAFLVEIITDTAYIYQFIAGNLQIGDYTVPLWPVSVLFGGLAGLYTQEPMNESKYHNHNPKRLNIFMMFPYVGGVILQLLVLQSYSKAINALSVGITIVIVIIFIYQILVRLDNNKLTQKYMHLAYHDILTGLQNRSKFLEDLDYAIDHAKSNQDKIFLMIIDIDRFKVVNDTFGHDVGDQLLVEFSNRLLTSAEDKKLLYRLGGDEFVVVLYGKTHAFCTMIANRIMKQSVNPYVIANHKITVTPSIGISAFPRDGDNYDELFKNADTAMYYVKEQGKNNYQFYNVD